ncbi:MAG: L,D-transpeptidase [Candidatus Methanomethylicaceae archaeon]
MVTMRHFPFYCIVLMLVVFVSGCRYETYYTDFSESPPSHSCGTLRVFYKTPHIPPLSDTAVLEEKPPALSSHIASSQVQIFVYKGMRRMFVFSGDNLVGTFDVGLGRSPEGNKMVRGDKRTPEGFFKVWGKKPSSRFYKSIGIDYPTPAHAKRAYEMGIISRGLYESILRAHESGKLPPQDTPLGGHIYIHGGGALANWTNGCIAMNNKDIDVIYPLVTPGSSVSVYP